jgi:hypothetical protein
MRPARLRGPALLFTTSTGHPLEPRNVKCSFDSRCKRARVRRIKIQDTRRTCGSLLAADGGASTTA